MRFSLMEDRRRVLLYLVTRQRKGKPDRSTADPAPKEAPDKDKDKK